jgi:hypothetical protein
MTQTIEVQYSCPDCALVDVGVHVQARTDEDVREWMDQTVQAVNADHAQRSRACRPQRIGNLKIPIEGADRVGGPVVH